VDRCLCGAADTFDRCCGVYIGGNHLAPTPEALMRARYSAYSLGNIDFIQRTCAGQALADFDYLAAQEWSNLVQFVALVIQDTHHTSTHGHVQFQATYIENGKTQVLSEFSVFQYLQGAWVYVQALLPPA